MDRAILKIIIYMVVLLTNEVVFGMSRAPYLAKQQGLISKERLAWEEQSNALKKRKLEKGDAERKNSDELRPLEQEAQRVLYPPRNSWRNLWGFFKSPNVYQQKLESEREKERANYVARLVAFPSDVSRNYTSYRVIDPTNPNVKPNIGSLLKDEKSRTRPYYEGKNFDLNALSNEPFLSKLIHNSICYDKDAIGFSINPVICSPLDIATLYEDSSDVYSLLSEEVDCDKLFNAALIAVAMRNDDLDKLEDILQKIKIVCDTWSKTRDFAALLKVAQKFNKPAFYMIWDIFPE
jgi:hypothetical protein